MNLLPDRTLARTVLRMSSPAVAGLSSQMVVSVVETAMVGRLQSTEVMLAALGIGLLATWAITSFFSSLATGIHVVAARRFGEADHAGAGSALNNGLAVAILLGLVFSGAGVAFSYDIINFFSSDPAVAEAGEEYMQWRFIGLLFFLPVVSYRGFFNGIGHTKVFMYSAIIVNLSNIILNYIFIFGALGFPRMELAGAGCANAVSNLLGLLFFLSVTFLRAYRKTYMYYTSLMLNTKVMAQIIRISAPVSFQNVLILFGFLVFVSITGVLGTVEQAASQIVISALFMSFLPCFGFGIGAQTLVGQSMGTGDFDLAKRYGLEAAKIATYFTVILGSVFILFPDAVIRVITTNDTVAERARVLLQLAGGAQVFYASGIVLAHALQAAGATFYVMKIEVITHWIVFLPICYVFGVTLGGGVVGAWMALPVYIASYTILIYLKYRKGTWLQIKV